MSKPHRTDRGLRDTHDEFSSGSAERSQTPASVAQSNRHQPVRAGACTSSNSGVSLATRGRLLCEGKRSDLVMVYSRTRDGGWAASRRATLAFLWECERFVERDPCKPTQISVRIVTGDALEQVTFSASSWAALSATRRTLYAPSLRSRGSLASRNSGLRARRARDGFASHVWIVVTKHRRKPDRCGQLRESYQRFDCRHRRSGLPEAHAAATSLPMSPGSVPSSAKRATARIALARNMSVLFGLNWKLLSRSTSSVSNLWRW